MIVDLSKNTLVYVVDCYFFVLSGIMSGPYAPTVISCTASGNQIDKICLALKKQSVAVHRINRKIVMRTVTIKMFPINSTTRVGVVAGLDITWLASTKAAATKLTALINLNAAQ